MLNPAMIAVLQSYLSKVSNKLFAHGGRCNVPGTATSRRRTQLTFQPATDLTVSTTYTVTASGFRTLAGVPMATVFMGTFATNAVTECDSAHDHPHQPVQRRNRGSP